MANLKQTLISRAVCAALAMTGGVTAYAQENGDDSLEVTIRLLPENAVGPEDITRRIELPPAARNPAPRVESGDPPGQANENRGRDDAANDARERGRAVGQEAAEQTRGNREDAGRPDDRGPPDERGRPDDPGQPGGPPDDRGRPDDPGQPGGPPDDRGRPDDPGQPGLPPGQQ